MEDKKVEEVEKKKDIDRYVNVPGYPCKESNKIQQNELFKAKSIKS